VSQDEEGAGEYKLDNTDDHESVTATHIGDK
jgi:hypothetical protein